ncbi:biotin--[acetyl-CoA-carboxylase] ligase [Formosa sediminum]|uniref:Biotin--[acetyl-CoA-carboxylase] ligase n=1 Tax=Formosa sediminum TaxID=2594004 RepID=A0A516GQQ8_9FLAO|nr:biotin--[acetyl-CoA-carboxylase] ligase [Formosa sediminum]QDO93839.1 biotin--[acetyl-CoA-carboxylase] ligase [Formosa sediminum]
MHIIKLDAIDSTNTFLKQLSSCEMVEDYTVVVAKHQTMGRGQMGTVWESEPAKNLMFSVFRDVSFVPIEKQFYISMVTAIAIYKALKKLLMPRVKIKWPNDILSADKKICGVLIENIVTSSGLRDSVLGIGVNVNQTNFKELPKASSIVNEVGCIYNLDEVLHHILVELKECFAWLERGQFEKIKATYESVLFKKNKPSTFLDVKGHMFSGFILGVTELGNLKVLLEDEIIKVYNLKEITLLY